MTYLLISRPNALTQDALSNYNILTCVSFHKRKRVQFGCNPLNVTLVDPTLAVPCLSVICLLMDRSIYIDGTSWLFRDSGNMHIRNCNSGQSIKQKQRRWHDPGLTRESGTPGESFEHKMCVLHISSGLCPLSDSWCKRLWDELWFL